MRSDGALMTLASVARQSSRGVAKRPRIRAVAWRRTRVINVEMALHQEES